MRLIAPRNAGPAAVNKYLLPHEHQVITVRKHPAVLLGPILIALAGVLIAVVLGTTVLRHSHDGIIVLVLVAVALLLYLGFKAWEWAEDYFVVTSDRMLQASGVFTRKIAMMPLVKVTDMSFQRSTLGRLLGFGEFILESAGQDQALRTIDHVPYPGGCSSSRTRTARRARTSVLCARGGRRCRETPSSRRIETSATTESPAALSSLPRGSCCRTVQRSVRQHESARSTSLAHRPAGGTARPVTR